MSISDGRLTIPKPLRKQGAELDDRFHAAKGVRTLLRKVFPDHWTFLLGEIALYSFIILILTGIFLTLFFNPSMTQVVYHGSYTKLNGVRMSEAYQSTLRISFDVRGGLLMRQIHHWAADLFLAAIMCHLLRIFFTGAYRKPRETNWLIGLGLFTLGIFEGFLGYSMPDDLLSGTGVRIAEGVLLGIPVVGSYLSFFLFGGQFPGTEFVVRFYIIHVLLIPGLLLALVSAHLFLMVHQKHTQMPGKGRTDANVVGQPTYPYFMVKTGAFFFFVFGVLALLATFAQINPIWQVGPYTPVAISAGSQPDFYMGWLEGALRMFPSWTWDIGGHTVAWNVLVPALLVMGVLFAALGAWPFAGTVGHRGQGLPPRQRPAAERPDPHRVRHGRGHLLRRSLAGRRQRHHRRETPDPAVPDHGDRPLGDLHRAGDRLLGHPARSAWGCSAGTHRCSCTAWRPASSCSSRTAPSSSWNARWTRRRSRSSRPSRRPRSPGAARWTTTAYRSRPGGAPWARCRSRRTGSSPRASRWSRPPTGTGTVMATGTPSTAGTATRPSRARTRASPRPSAAGPAVPSEAEDGHTGEDGE